MSATHLEEALSYARVLVEMAHRPLAAVDRELRLRHANSTFDQLLGIEVGTRVDEALPLPQLADVVSTGTMLLGAELARAGRQLVVNARMLDTPGGVREVLLVAVEDLTERRATERALRYHEYLLAAITQAVISLDTNWRILTWNVGAERLLGFTAEEAIGKRSDEVVLVDAAVDHERIRGKLLAGHAVQSQGLIQHKFGEWMEMETSTVPVRDSEGLPIGFVVIMHDLRAVKHQERQLREHARKVEEANRELDSFTYSVSHDLRAPLRAIDGFSRILVEDFGERMSSEEARLLAVIRKNTQQMGQLIDDLLAFARMGRKDMTLGKVDMNALLDELVPEVMVGTEARAIDLRIAPLPAAMGDRALLKQVWLNLLGNAVKYTRGRERTVISISGEAAQFELLYRIDDNGAGFDMQYMDKLFGVFQRLHQGSEFEGTGVGLALVQRIVRRHGGRVWAEGKDGVGATFSFALPRRGGNDE